MTSGDSSTSHSKFVRLISARLLIALFAGAQLLGLAAFAAAQSDDSSLGIVNERPLRAGQFQWSDEAARDYMPLVIVVSLDTQRARVYQGEVLIGVTSISSGKPGHRTPTGNYTILQKKRFHRSNLYDDAPMPYMLRLTWDGLAIHGGYLPGRPASHGCIRVPHKFAQKLFSVASYDTTVIVTNREPRSISSALRVNEMHEPDVVPMDPLDRPYEP